MPQKRSSPDPCVKFLRLKKVVTLADLIVHLQCSRRTVQRRLAQRHAINSYNQNGRYYTLPDIPQFDANGLWRYRGAFFSRHGNLPETFVQLVHNAASGLAAAEVGALLGLRPSSFLWSLRDRPALKREKHHGHYVYLASEPGRYAQQQRQRALLRQTTRRPTEAEAIAILVEKIKHPALSVAALSQRLGKQHLRAEPEMIGNFFAHHGLSVKKTPHSP